MAMREIWKVVMDNPGGTDIELKYSSQDKSYNIYAGDKYTGSVWLEVSRDDLVALRDALIKELS